MKRRPSLLGALTRLGAAAALGVAAAQGRLADADEQARKAIFERHSETLDAALPVLTDFGSSYAVAGTGAVLWLFGKRALAKDVVGAGFIAWSLAQVTKRLYRRARPYDVDEITLLVRKPSGQSYPSGHPAVANAVATVLQPRVREPLRGMVSRLPRMVAFSRVYVGVHYPTDVIGGLMMGRAIGDLWRRYAVK